VGVSLLFELCTVATCVPTSNLSVLNFENPLFPATLIFYIFLVLKVVLFSVPKIFLYSPTFSVVYKCRKIPSYDKIHSDVTVNQG